MRFHSTPKSVADGEITILAIIECILSVALYVGIGIHFGSFRYLAWAVVVAPLMLFRTERSTSWGTDQIFFPVGGQIVERVSIGRKPSDSRTSPATLSSVSRVVIRTELIIFAISILGGLTRILSPLIWFLRKPLEALKEAPLNWQRQSLCTDFYFPPEMVPAGRTTPAFDIPAFGGLLRSTGPRMVNKLGVILISLPLLVIGFLPPVIYRVTFKATAIAYLPFIWIAHWTLSKTLPIKARLERITKGELEKVRRGVSWSILLILIAKIALIFGWIDLTFLVSKFPNQKIVDYFVAPTHWPWWQLTLISDAALTFLLFFLSDAALARLEGDSAWSGEKILTAVSSASFIRAVISLATMTHFFYTAFISVVPEAFKRLFP